MTRLLDLLIDWMPRALRERVADRERMRRWLESDVRHL